MLETYMPLVSIGLPVLNGEKKIAAVLDSLLKQSLSDFELIISDNASSDLTEIICREYASRDVRIKYFKQNTNIGQIRNFQFVLNQSIGKYFMWAAADDLRTSDYLEENVAILENNPSCIFSAPSNCFEGDENINGRTYDFEIRGTIYDRINFFLKICSKSHACFYAVIKRESLRNFIMLKNDYLAFDWIVIIELLEQGEFHRSKHGKLVLGKNGVSMQPNFYKKMQKLHIEKLIPLYQFSKSFVNIVHRSEGLTVTNKTKLFCKLFLVNWSVAYQNFLSNAILVYKHIIVRVDPNKK
jgi:glycosyltransferase involved in cell wall biosynthesis